MNKIYLVVIDLYDIEENSIVNICTTREKAENLMNEYENSWDDSHCSHYHIDEVDLDFSKDVIWDCYKNSIFSTND